MSTAAHRSTKTMVVLGEHGAGKATLMGNLMYKCGGVDMRLLEKLQRDGINNYDQVLGYCKDHHIEPSFEAPHTKILLREEAADAGRVDILVYVLDATAEVPWTKIGAESTVSSNVVVAVNKMDACDWSEASYVRALKMNRPRAQQQGLDLDGFSIIPISALYGENILELSSKSPWFFANSPRHQTLVEAINAASDA